MWENYKYGYNNVANKLEFIQTISRELIRSSPGKKFIELVNVTINSSWQIVYAGINNLLN